jgi:hypothetical protein
LLYWELAYVFQCFILVQSFLCHWNHLCDSILVDRAVISNDNIFVCGETSNSSIFFTNCTLFWPWISTLLYLVLSHGSKPTDQKKWTFCEKQCTIYHPLEHKRSLVRTLMQRAFLTHPCKPGVVLLHSK